MWREYLHWTAAATQPVPSPAAPQPSPAPLLSLATRFMAAQVPAMELQALDFLQLPPLQVSLLHAGSQHCPFRAAAPQVSLLHAQCHCGISSWLPNCLDMSCCPSTAGQPAMHSVQRLPNLAYRHSVH